MAAAIQRHEVYHELILWCEYDLFDQLNLSQLLTWIHTPRPLEPRGRQSPLSSVVALTDAGRAVLSGELDRIATCGIDRWLGGVHLEGARSSVAMG